MRTLRMAFAAVIVLLVVVLAVFFWRPDWRARLGLRSWPLGGGAGRTVALLEETEPPPLPNISLQINGQHKPAILQGTPLILSVRLANQRAMNAAAGNSANDKEFTALQAAVARGEISKEKAETRIARLQKKREIRVVQLGDAGAGWDQFVHMGVQLPDGKPQPLSWPVKLAAPPQAKSVTLDEKATVQIDYALEPAAATQISPGDYQVIAALEVPAQAQLPSDRWRGRVESEPVKLHIAAKPARLTSAEKEKSNLEFARYYALLGDNAQALAYAQRAVAANPKSIPAHVLVAEAKERQGDLAGALASYQVALREFYEQYPKSYEAPLYLLDKSAELMRKLNLTPGQAAPKPR